MISGYGSNLEKEDIKFTSVGTPKSGQQFGTASVPLLRQVNADNLAPLKQDTIQNPYGYAVFDTVNLQEKRESL